MENQAVAETLELIASLLELKGENPFKVRAYQNAARTVEGLTASVETLAREGRLGELPGFGEALQSKVGQLVTTGRMDYLEELKESVPAGHLEMMRIPFLGPKKIQKLSKELGINTLQQLKSACDEGKVASLKGFGEKTQKKLLEGIELLAKHAGEFRLGDALPIAEKLVAQLRESGLVGQISIAGSLRRWKEIVHDIDIVATSKQPEEVMAVFVAAEGVQSVLGKGPTKSSVRMRNGLQVDLRVVKESEFAPALVYFTGSKAHNILLRGLAQKQGMTLNEYGLAKGDRALACETEESVFKHLGLKWIPPELREGRQEVEAAAGDGDFDLVDITDLKGVFHVHSTWSDGTADIPSMAAAAQKLGLSYIGLSDHSKTAAYANGLDEKRLRSQMVEVRKLNEGFKNFTILIGLECDILPDGSMDCDPDLLEELDFVIGSVHSRFDMDSSTMTERICKALRNPHVTMLGHPTGRLLLDREGYRVDIDEVVRCAARENKIIELNANPHRLDLDDAHLRLAKELGVMISINPDAHSPKGLSDIVYGIGTARRAGLSKKNILNTKSLRDVLNYLGSN